VAGVVLQVGSILLLATADPVVVVGLLRTPVIPAYTVERVSLVKVTMVVLDFSQGSLTVAVLVVVVQEVRGKIERFPRLGLVVLL